MEVTIEKAFQKLEANLEDLTKVYRSLLDVVRKEKELLLQADREALEENNKIKEDILFKLRTQDALRSRYATDLASLVGGDTENPRLLELAQKIAGTPISERLRTQHATLDMLIRRITEINKDNEELAKTALKSLNGALNEVRGTISGKSTYGGKGQVKNGPNTSGNFVSKEA